jgi:hypothetical protein
MWWGRHDPILDGSLRRSDGWYAVILRPSGDHRDFARCLLMRTGMTRYLNAHGIRIFDYPQQPGDWHLPCRQAAAVTP